MTWKELANKIHLMSPEEQEQMVYVWGEDMSLRTGNMLEKTDEDMYYNDDFDGVSYPESLLDDYKPEECELVCEKGTYYINLS